jgi:hypothetical protein
VKTIRFTIFVLATTLVPGCEMLSGNPTPDAVPWTIGDVWVRHLIDKYDRESTAVVGFTLKDRSNRPVAADGKVKVELNWDQGMRKYKAYGDAPVRARKFRQAEAGTPTSAGDWYTEPWSIYMIGAQYPGPAKFGYNASIVFTTEEGKKLRFGQYVRVSR